MTNQIKGIVFTALLVLSVFAAGVGTVSAAGDTEVSVTPTNASVDVGDTQTFDIVVDSGSDGTQGYNITVDLSNESVGNITSADTRGDPALEDKVQITPDNNAVTIVGGYLNPVSGSEPLTIATVTVESTAEGSTDLRISRNSEVRDDNNRKYSITGYNAATMTVTDPSADFQVSNLAAPDTVLQGDTFAATATVSNAGSVSGTETVEFSVNGSVVATRNVTLAAGASQSISLSTGTSNLPTGDQPLVVTAGGSSAMGQITIADTTVGFNPSGSTTTIGNSQTYDVVVNQGIDGSQGYALTVDLSNATVAEITSADTVGSPGLQDKAAIDSKNDTVNITAGYFNALNGSVPLTIATVTVEGAAKGTAQLAVDSSSEIRDGDNDKYVVGAFNPANVTVISSGPAFQVSNLDVPRTVLQGDTISASATITNVGTAGSVETVELDFGGNVVASTSVNLSAGASQNVTISTNSGSLPVGQQTAAVSAGSSSASRTVTIAETDLSVEPASTVGSVGSTQTFDVVITRGSEGSQGYNVTVQLSNASVAEITSANSAGSPSLGSSVQINSDNDSVNIEAGYANPLPGVQPLTIANVTVEATAEGSTDLELASGSEVRNGTNAQYVIGAYNAAELLVGQSVIVPGSQGPANDPDGDSLFEDVDGDGKTDVFDAITLYNNRNSNVVQSNQQSFDFDGDGSVDVFDAIALYNEIS